MKSPLCSLGFGRTAALPAVHVTVRLATTKPTITTSYTVFPHSPRRYTNLFISNSKYSCTLRRVLSPTTQDSFDMFLPSDEYGNTCDTEKDTIKRVIAATTKSIILACMIGLVGLGLGANIGRCAPNQALAIPPGIQVRITGGLSGKYAVSSLMEVSNYLSSNEGNKLGSRHIGALFQRKSEIDPNKGPSKENADELKKEAMQQLKLGKSQKAEKILKDEYERWKDYAESAYYIDMALVEILISQGKYEEAKSRECLNKKADGPSDPRIPLYKAIIYTVENDPQGEQMAMKYWDEFLETIREEAGRQQS